MGGRGLACETIPGWRGLACETIPGWRGGGVWLARLFLGGGGGVRLARLFLGGGGEGSGLDYSWVEGGGVWLARLLSSVGIHILIKTREHQGKKRKLSLPFQYQPSFLIFSLML